MSLRKREKIQELLRKAIITLLFFAPCGIFASGPAIYLHCSPSLPICNDWLENVDTYPAFEGGISLEIPTSTIFRARFELTFVDLPSGGALEEGYSFYGGAGVIVRQEIARMLDVDIGPQIIIGTVNAKGTYRLDEADSGLYDIEFDGTGSGVGIGIVGGLNLHITKHLRAGVSAAVVYFNLLGKEIPIVGHNLLDPGEPEEYSKYDYQGEYIAVSFRLSMGYEF